MIKNFLFSMITLLSIVISGHAQETTGNKNVSKEFKVCPFNVDGLPVSINVPLVGDIEINNDGLGEDGAKAIGEYIANSNIDFLALSEDFNFHTSLMESLGEGYQAGTYRGGITSDNYKADISFDTDGLVFLAKNPFTFSQETWTRWNKSNGKFDKGNDELIHKGYRHTIADLGDGVLLDFYFMHMDAESNPEDNAARASQLEQLRDAILSNHSNRPIIVMGDTNCRYTRDDIKGLFIAPIEEAGNYEVKDAWVELCKDGVYPELGADPLMVGDLGYKEGEVVDKVLYLNPTKNGMNISAIKFEIDEAFDKTDHKPVIVTMKIEGNTYAAADANAWWRGEELQGNGQLVYIYNIGKGIFIAGKTPSIKNIDEAFTWNINGNSPYTFACTNETQDRIALDCVVATSNSWNAQIKQGSGASDLTLLPGQTTNRGFCYKLSKTAKVGLFSKHDETRYFNAEDTKYTAASSQGVDNDWLFISEEQKDAYNEYKELFNKARSYQAYELSEELSTQLTQTLDETEKGSYDTYSTDKAALEAIIAAIDKYLDEMATGIGCIRPTQTSQKSAMIYNINGIQQTQFNKGLNIIKMADGTVKKVRVK